MYKKQNYISLSRFDAIKNALRKLLNLREFLNVTETNNYVVLEKHKQKDEAVPPSCNSTSS